MSYSRVGSICLAVAYVSLFVEFRKRVMARQPITVSESTNYKQQMEPAPLLVPDEVHPLHAEPGDETIVYRPQREENDSFEAVGESIDRKGTFESQSLPETTEKFLVSQGLI